MVEMGGKWWADALLGGPRRASVLSVELLVGLERRRLWVVSGMVVDGDWSLEALAVTSTVWGRFWVLC
jgi:hypothetical protein